MFPFDFGYVPSTLAEDGDPLDVLLLMDAPVPAGPHQMSSSRHVLGQHTPGPQ